MKLRKAIPMSQFQDEEMGRRSREERQEDREARRDRRRERRADRRETRSGRKADRRDRRQERAESREQGGRRERRRERRQEEPQETALVRAPQGYPAPMPYQAPQAAYPPQQPPWPQGKQPMAPPMQPFEEDGAEDEEDLPFDEEVMGFAFPHLRRRRFRVAPAAPALLAPAPAAASPAPALPAVPDRWSPAARMGMHMRLQARQGFRAAVIEIKPGLYMVAELPEQLARPEFGVVPLIAPMMIKATQRVMARRQANQQQAQDPAQPQRQGLLAMFRHPQAGPPQVVQPQPAPLQLPGPVAQAAAPAAQTVLMPPPPPGSRWATPEEVAGFYGFPLVVR